MTEYDLCISKYLNQWRTNSKTEINFSKIEKKIKEDEKSNRKDYIKSKWKYYIQSVIDEKYKKLKIERNELKIEKDKLKIEKDKKLMIDQSTPPPYGVCDYESQFYRRQKN